MLTIREESPDDISAIRRVNELAFGQAAEADLVDRLRHACPDTLSLVAEDGGILGHIFFSPVQAGGAGDAVIGMGLAPMAVLPDRQRRGVGSELVRRGVEILRQRGCPFVVVVGHPQYYPRFGFEPASKHRIASQWDGIPDAAFMVLVLDPHAMAGLSGVAKYRNEFNDAV